MYMYNVSLKKVNESSTAKKLQWMTGGLGWGEELTFHFTPLHFLNCEPCTHYSKNKLITNQTKSKKCDVGQQKVEATIPEAAIRPSSGTFGLPVARTAKIRPSLVRMYVPKNKQEEDC